MRKQKGAKMTEQETTAEFFKISELRDMGIFLLIDITMLINSKIISNRSRMCFSSKTFYKEINEKR